jgi:hypothetical protein
MNDMVSIKKIRPRSPALDEEDWEEETAWDGACAAPVAGAVDPGPTDFFRGGNPPSVAAGKPLEINPEAH